MADCVTLVVIGMAIMEPRSRLGLKKGDKLIKKEAERERTMEIEKEANRGMEANLKHHKHQDHLLYEVDGAEGFVCGGCGKSGHGRRYRCSVDGFEMHRVCAISKPVVLVDDHGRSEGRLPETLETFAHNKHGCLKKVYAKVDLFECYHCNNVGKGFRYRCGSERCSRTFHPICAKSPTRINSFMHPDHELELVTRPYFANCAVCNRGRKSRFNNRVYACKACKFYLHPTCSLWPQYLFHELHPKPHDPLQLKTSPTPSTCRTCKKKDNGSAMYCCDTCHESYHPKCLARTLFRVEADGENARAFKEMLELSKIRDVEFVGIDHLGLIG